MKLCGQILPNGVSVMEGRPRHRDRRLKSKVLQLPKLSLGLTNVKFIVNKFEEENTKVIVERDAREIVKYEPNIDVDEGYRNFPFDPSKGQVWKRFLIKLATNISGYIPSVSYGNLGVVVVLTSVLGPRMLSYLVLYPLCRLVFGTLYPAYASYKAVRTKNLKEYVSF